MALPDWKEALTPEGAQTTAAPAVMNVNFDGRTYSFEVKPGPEGYSMFTEAIRRAFDLPEDSELNITFTCDEPTVPELGSLLTLQGPGAYDAAVHCATVSAARRMMSSEQQQQHEAGNVLRTTSLPCWSGHEMSEEVHQPVMPHSHSSPSRLQRNASLPSHMTTDFMTQSDHMTQTSADVNDGRSLHGPQSPSAAKRRLSGISRKVRSLLDMLAPKA